MSWHIPPRPLWLRWLLILVSGAIFFWTGVEDDRIGIAVTLGTLFCGVILAHWLTGALTIRVLHDDQIWMAWAFFGALTGGGGIVTAVIIMAFKDARHAHPFPDYPIGLLADLIARAPVWALAGAFVGLGVYAAWRAASHR